jgi:hypothetical protein
MRRLSPRLRGTFLEKVSMKYLRRAVSMIVLSSAIAMPLLPIIGDAPAVATCGSLFATGGISLPNAVHQQIRSKECK